MTALGSAICKGRHWLDRFTRREYKKAFGEYTALYRDGCLAQLEAYRDDPETLAEQLLQELEDFRRGSRFWNRSAEIFDQKQMVIKYLSPMLLQLGEDAFAGMLQQAWRRRWPKDPYEMASFDDLNRSFLNVIMGITLKDDK